MDEEQEDTFVIGMLCGRTPSDIRWSSLGVIEAVSLSPPPPAAAAAAARNASYFCADD